MRTVNSRRLRRRDWESTADKLEVLIRNAQPEPRFTVICGDGTVVRMSYTMPDHKYASIERFTLHVPPDRGDEANEILAYGYQDGMHRTARGMFRQVPPACMVDLIWQFGGVDLRASREANKARDRHAEGR